MNEEIYDPDCGACERAQQDYAELERVTDDLAALVRQLVRSNRRLVGTLNAGITKERE